MSIARSKLVSSSSSLGISALRRPNISVVSGKETELRQTCKFAEKTVAAIFVSRETLALVVSQMQNDRSSLPEYFPSTARTRFP